MIETTTVSATTTTTVYMNKPKEFKSPENAREIVKEYPTPLRIESNFQRALKVCQSSHTLHKKRPTSFALMDCGYFLLF